MTLKEFSSSLFLFRVSENISRLCEFGFQYDYAAVLELSLKMTLIKLEINKLTEQHLCTIEWGDGVPITRCRDFI